MSSRPVYSDVDPASMYVSIYCAAASHAADPWRIATFYVPSDPDWPAWPDGTPRWSESVGHYVSASGTVHAFDTAAARTSLVDDRVETDTRRLEALGSRSRSRLHCRRCDLTVTARTERLDPVLTRLRSVGVSELSLSALRSMLDIA